MVTIQDGVVSGKCAMTTFGNTMRSIVAHRYNAQRIGLKTDEYHIQAAGDDCVILVESKDAEKF